MGLISDLLGKKLSPLIYTIQVPAIAAGGNKVYRLHESPLSMFAEDYAPFNGMTVQNLSAANIQVLFNYSTNNFLYVASGGVQVRKNQTFCNFQIINTSNITAIDADQITVWIEKI